MKRVIYICDACRKEAPEIICVEHADLCRKCAEKVRELLKMYDKEVKEEVLLPRKEKRVTPGSKPHRPDIDTDEIVKLRSEGMSAMEISEKLGLGYKSVLNRLKGRRRIDLKEEEIAEMYKSGLSCSEIGRKVGCNYHAVSAKLKAMGLFDPEKKHTSGAHYLDDKQVAELYKGGMKLQEIARELGCSESGVRSALDRMGLRKMKKRTNQAIKVSKKEVEELRDQGLPTSQIAEKLKVSTKTVKGVEEESEEENAERLKKGRERGQVSVDLGKVKALARAGWSAADIADELGVKEEAIRMIVKGAKK